MLDNQLIGEQLLIQLDPTRCSLILVAKKEYAQFSGSLSLGFSELWWSESSRMSMMPDTTRDNHTAAAMDLPWHPHSTVRLSGRAVCLFTAALSWRCIFLPDPQWAAIIAVVMNRSQVFAEGRLWLDGAPFLTLAQGMGRQELVPLLPATWRYCKCDIPTQLVQCIQLLSYLAGV